MQVLRQVKLEQPKPAGTAVKTVLGGINVNLRTMGKRFDYKDEYEHFKLRSVPFSPLYGSGAPLRLCVTRCAG